jgi:sulfide dehydrogenase [flavocytochrome c] flavoprotein subunit
MSNFDRRDFLSLAGGSVLAATGLFAHRAGAAIKKARVVVVGGGYGGAIAAKYLKLAEPDMEVVLVEKGRRFVSCPFSNEVLAGDAAIDSLSFGYEGLARRGIKVVFDNAIAIDAQARKIRLEGGRSLNYDRAIVSPGIDFKWGAIQGYDQAAAELLPHAWKAGPQTTLLARQIQDMKDGGVVVITAPDNPFRCPPGPYERAAQIAHYLKRHKPRAKVIILDSKDKFSKQPLFLQGWTQHYPGMIEWVAAAKGGEVEGVDPRTRTATSVVGNKHQADVLNVIPPQQAGRIAHAAGLVDAKGWCPVNPLTFESALHKGIHVIGDACVGGAMPKSAYSANSQAKVCVEAIVAVLREQAIVDDPPLTNTCYSLITPDHGISVAHIFQVRDGKIGEIPGSGGVSPLDATAAFRKMEATYARSWFKNITTEMFD